MGEVARGWCEMRLDSQERMDGEAGRQAWDQLPFSRDGNDLKKALLALGCTLSLLVLSLCLWSNRFGRFLQNLHKLSDEEHNYCTRREKQSLFQLNFPENRTNLIVCFQQQAGRPAQRRERVYYVEGGSRGSEPEGLQQRQ